MPIIPFHIVDAFAERPFTGNPAAIIPNASNLSDQEMFQITEELSMEAGFVLPPLAAGADVRLRFFTRNCETRLSGHVAIAAFASMCDRGFYRPTPAGTKVRVETGMGILPVTLRCGENGCARITLGLPAPRFGEPVPATEVAAALDVAPEVLWADGHEPQRVSCGFDQIIVPVSDRAVIRGVDRDAPGIARLIDSRGVGGLTLFCPETHSEEADYHCRHFHPHLGHAEDIASGTSLAAAACYIVANGLVPPGDRVTLRFEQGHALGRPTRAEVLVGSGADGPELIEVTAAGVVVMRGSFQFNRLMMSALG